MSKVLIITDGEYSDYRIKAVFTEDKRDLADKHCEMFGGEIEEWDLNPREQKLREGYAFWHIYLDRDGNQPSNRKSRCTLEEDGLRIYIFEDLASRSRKVIGCFNVEAQSEEQARKIANEFRVQIIAANNWVAGNGWSQVDGTMTQTQKGGPK